MTLEEFFFEKFLFFEFLEIFFWLKVEVEFFFRRRRKRSCWAATVKGFFSAAAVRSRLPRSDGGTAVFFLLTDIAAS